ncbi:MAG TPA: GNAT family N-acetyltransferase [Gaiellaceae bacterium]|nr:GNAT family N-acetyltransferase [Gaiellaceae bacterium]
MTTLEFREAAEHDVERVVELCNVYERAVAEEPEILSAEDLLRWWRRESERRLVVDGEELVGFAYLQRRHERWDGDGWVHPDAFGRGVGGAIADWIEARAQALGSPEVRIGILRADGRAACLLRGRGFEPIRTFFRMVIDLVAEPAQPEWPEGFTVVSAEQGDEHELYEVLEDAFVDHWGHASRTYEEWLATHEIEHELSFLVRTGDATAAGALCRRELFGMGWVDVLGTRREFRRLGLGEALLRHAFRELYRRGARRVGLGVDSENTTGATRLYERVGMRVAAASDVYAKKL